VALDIYKRGQGKYTRGATFGAGALIGLLLAHYVFAQLQATSINDYKFVLYGIPLIIFAGLAVLMYWIVNRPTSADFMIATEGEMKKVSWSSKKEVIGGTKVVIATTLIMALVLWGVDLAFAFFFQAIGVLQLSANIASVGD
jgi:preprotein translocase subunit SecE